MSNEAQVQLMTERMAKFIAHTGKKLPDDVIAKLAELREKEDSPMAKVIYDTMFRNQELAIELNRPSCQDTGGTAILGEVRHKVPPDRRSGGAAERGGGESYL